ncbi:MAG: hypothetical protein LBD59_04450 [Prevotellaceae bacterium]|nr:hypothetical protein [Prevotellaceae bacterium]
MARFIVPLYTHYIYIVGDEYSTRPAVVLPANGDFRFPATGLRLSHRRFQTKGLDYARQVNH